MRNHIVTSIVIKIYNILKCWSDLLGLVYHNGCLDSPSWGFIANESTSLIPL